MLVFWRKRTEPLIIRTLETGFLIAFGCTFLVMQTADAELSCWTRGFLMPAWAGAHATRRSAKTRKGPNLGPWCPCAFRYRGVKPKGLSSPHTTARLLHPKSAATGFFQLHPLHCPIHRSLRCLKLLELTRAR